MVTIVGHRGAAGIAPENTVAAVERAAAIGVDRVEFDVRETADGHLVAVHDGTVDRTTDGTGRVAELTLSELRRLDAGDGETVPTLGEMLDAVADLGVGTYIELKEPGIADRVVAAAAERGVVSGAEFTAWEPDILREIADRDVSVGGPVRETDPETARMAAETGYEHVGIHHEAVTPAAVERFHDRGIRVGAWPVNDEETLAAVLDCGVDAVTTDRPDVVHAALRG